MIGHQSLLKQSFKFYIQGVLPHITNNEVISISESIYQMLRDSNNDKNSLDLYHLVSKISSLKLPMRHHHHKQMSAIEFSPSKSYKVSGSGLKQLQTVLGKPSNRTSNNVSVSKQQKQPVKDVSEFSRKLDQVRQQQQNQSNRSDIHTKSKSPLTRVRGESISSPTKLDTTFQMTQDTFPKIELTQPTMTILEVIEDTTPIYQSKPFRFKDLELMLSNAIREFNKGTSNLFTVCEHTRETKQSWFHDQAKSPGSSPKFTDQDLLRTQRNFAMKRFIIYEKRDSHRISQPTPMEPIPKDVFIVM